MNGKIKCSIYIILLNLQKEVLSHATTGMNLEDRKSSHKKTNTVRFHLHEVSKLVKFIENESGGYGEGRMGNCLMGSVSVLQDEKVLLEICFTIV